MNKKFLSLVLCLAISGQAGWAGDDKNELSAAMNNLSAAIKSGDLGEINTAVEALKEANGRSLGERVYQGTRLEDLKSNLEVQAALEKIDSDLDPEKLKERAAKRGFLWFGTKTKTDVAIEDAKKALAVASGKEKPESVFKEGFFDSEATMKLMSAAREQEVQATRMKNLKSDIENKKEGDFFIQEDLYLSNKDLIDKAAFEKAARNLSEAWDRAEESNTGDAAFIDNVRRRINVYNSPESVAGRANQRTLRYMNRPNNGPSQTRGSLATPHDGRRNPKKRGY